MKTDEKKKKEKKQREKFLIDLKLFQSKYYITLDRTSF